MFSGFSNQVATDTYQVSQEPSFLRGEPAKLPQTLFLWLLRALTDLAGPEEFLLSPLGALSKCPCVTCMIALSLSLLKYVLVSVFLEVYQDY